MRRSIRLLRRNVTASLIVILSMLNTTIGHASFQYLQGTIRDFKRGDMADGHPDFETFTNFSVVPGIVESTLGDGRKPVYASSTTTPTTTGAANFDQWYRDVPEVNQAKSYSLEFEDLGGGNYRFSGSPFTPIDDLLFGNQGLSHNYHFTFEAHANFVYSPGDYFYITSDDDAWVFINNELVVDLGGVHPFTLATVILDDLGLAPGELYSIDVFYAERREPNATLQIDTSLVFLPFLAGDYNNDGVVDAADYTVWRNLLGTAVAMPNETATLNQVTFEDYDVWKAHYGESLPVGISSIAQNHSSALVPEPMTLILIFLAAFGICTLLHRGCKREAGFFNSK